MTRKSACLEEPGFILENAFNLVRKQKREQLLRVETRAKPRMLTETLTKKRRPESQLIIVIFLEFAFVYIQAHLIAL